MQINLFLSFLSGIIVPNNFQQFSDWNGCHMLNFVKHMPKSISLNCSYKKVDQALEHELSICRDIFAIVIWECFYRNNQEAAVISILVLS